MRKQCVIISILFLFVSICFAADTKTASSHSTILQQLAHSAMITAVKESTSFSFSAVSFSMDSTELNSVIRNDVIGALLSRNIAVYWDAASADTVIVCNAQEATVSYGEIFSETLFGTRMVERTLSLTAQISCASQLDKRILFTKKLTFSNIDTVSYTDVQHLEEPTLPLQTLSPPQLSFFDSFIEPVIITVASAVAIYLFFTIRS